MRASSLPILWFAAAAVFVGGVGGVGCGSSPTPGLTGGAGGKGEGGATSSVTSAVSSTSTGAGGAGGSTATSGTGGSGGTGMGGATSSSSASGTGGSGGAMGACMTEDDCAPPAGECMTATCIAGVCGVANVAAGTPTMMQTPGDCLKNACDGNGAIASVNDDTDINDDSNPCTTDACAGGGVATHVPVAAGSACGVGQVCDAAGSCVGCVAAATCPGVDDECKTRTCTANVCGFSFTAAGTVTAAQTAADCKKNQCDGAGKIVPVADSTDLPVDNLQCTSDVCTAGVPSNPPTASGTACTQNNGTTCNGNGQCVQCLTASTCPGTDTQCQTRTCIAGACGVAFAAAGTVTATQTAGDCQKNTCNGSGTIVAITDNSDLPVDNLQCTNDVCTAGIPSNPPTAAGTACSQNGGTTCNAGGQCVQCATASTCPGQDTQCQTRTCTAGACGFSFTAAGTATAAQTPGDCKQNECNGAGAIVANPHNADVPVDNNLCTSDVCTQGIPSNPPVAAGSSCGAGLVCNAMGACLGCNTGADCPGTDTECQTRTCSNNTCGFSFTAAGTATAAQTAGDCKQNECNGAGAIVANTHNADVPNDTFQCTTDTCVQGVPTFTPVASGTACNQTGGTHCDAIGDCVQCNTASDCPGSDTDCHVRTCSAGACGVFNTAAGNPTTTQTTGNCQINQCDGAGNAVNVADNTDVPVDSKQCTSDVCTAGVPSNPNLAAGTACTQNGGTSCDGAGTCTVAGGPTTDFVVLRFGDGVAALTSASTAGFLEHRLIDGSSVATVTLPVAANGANKAITFAGSSTSEGSLSRSADGHYVTFGGYAVAPGIATIATTASSVNNRVVGRIDSTLNAATGLDTSTLFTAAFSAGNIRAVTSNDGTSFWAAGSVSAAQYILLGQSMATQINTTPSNIRTLHVFGSQLYGTSGSGTFVNVFSIGTGLPTMTGQTATSFTGMPTSTASPYSFVLLDRNAAVPGLDTLYLADDRAVGVNTGGIQKWTFDGTTWTQVNTLTSGATGFRGLAGVVTGANVTLIATTAGASANSVVVFVDDGSAAPAGTVIATAPVNTAYRGIAFAPK